VLWVDRQLVDLSQGVALDVNRSGIAVGAEGDQMEGPAMMWCQPSPAMQPSSL
jgi:hypothetical protein